MDNDMKDEFYVCHFFTGSQCLDGIETTNSLINPPNSDPRVRYTHD